jgi:hypothetical protein
MLLDEMACDNFELFFAGDVEGFWFIGIMIVKICQM